MEERKTFLRVRSHMMTDSSEFLNNWDQRKAWIAFSQGKKYVEALQLVLFMAVQNPGIDLNVLFKTDIQELGDAAGHIGLLYSKDGTTLLARTMYDPEGFGEPGEDFRGQTELYKDDQIVKKVYFGWAINGSDSIPYFPLDRVKTLEDAKTFFKWAGDNIGGGFHPDTPFAEYVDNGGEELFNPEEAERYDGLMDEARDVFADEEEMYECLESVTGLMAAVNETEKKYPVGTLFFNETNKLTLEVSEVDGIDDYGVQVFNKPKSIKDFAWHSEAEIDTLIKRGAWRVIEEQPDETEEHPEWSFQFNGFKVNVERDTLRENTKHRKYFEFNAVSISGESVVSGDVSVEYDIQSDDWEVSDVEFMDENEKRAFLYPEDDESDFLQTFQESIDVYNA
jgi:hypothetical protein